MKGFLTPICLVASISLISFAAFSNQSKWFSCSSYGCSVTLMNDRENERDETNISHILFGISGSAKTWSNRSRYAQLWWKPNVTRGFVWLDEMSPETEPWLETFPPYRVSQDTSSLNYTCSLCRRSVLRIVRIVKESFELGLENVRWFVMGDDDTVFFTENLVRVLIKYDHNQMYYIGGNSESVEHDEKYSYSMAYGGGGFAISYPLAAELAKILDGCISRYHYFYHGDEKIGGCMAEIGVPLTQELGFHQMDIQGSPRGLLAAHPLAPLVSLHHLDKNKNFMQPLIPSMSQVDSVKKVIEAYNKHPSRTMQQMSLCYDLKRNWSLLVSWGFSIQLYPWLMNAKELGMAMQTFKTWRGHEEPFTFNIRPYYADACKRPLEYYLDQVVLLPNIDETLTSYNRIDDSNEQCYNQRYGLALAIQKVNVTTLILSPQVWRQAPRRQCCEVMDGEHHIGTVLHIKIRDCNQFESATPLLYDNYGDFAYGKNFFNGYLGGKN